MGILRRFFVNRLWHDGGQSVYTICNEECSRDLFTFFLGHGCRRRDISPEDIREESFSILEFIQYANKSPPSPSMPHCLSNVRLKMQIQETDMKNVRYAVSCFLGSISLMILCLYRLAPHCWAA